MDGCEDFYSPYSRREKKEIKDEIIVSVTFLAQRPLISHLNYTRGRNGRGRNGPLQQLLSRVGPRRGRDGHLCLIVCFFPPCSLLLWITISNRLSRGPLTQTGSEWLGEEEGRLFHSARQQRQRVGQRRSEVCGGGHCSLLLPSSPLSPKSQRGVQKRRRRRRGSVKRGNSLEFCPLTVSR